jgi:hypothetical protein
MTDEVEHIPDDGIYEDSSEGFQLLTVSAGPTAEIREDKPQTLRERFEGSPGVSTFLTATRAVIDRVRFGFKDWKEFEAKYPLLSQEVRMKTFLEGKARIVDDDREYPSVPLNAEYQDLIRHNLLAPHAVERISDEDGIKEYTMLILTPTPKMTALIDELNKVAEQAEKESRKVRTQVTIDRDGVREKLELRSLIGLVLAKPESALRQCHSWIVELQNPDLPRVQRIKIGIYLSRAEALWGPEMDKLDPVLHLRILQQLGKPEKSCMWPDIDIALYGAVGGGASGGTAHV